MSMHLLVLLLLVRSAAVCLCQSTKFQKYPSFLRAYSAQEPLRKSSYRLSNPLIGDDGRVYICLERNLIAFESNGTIAWAVPLNHTCNARMAPVQGGARKLFLVAENKVLKINTLNVETSASAGEVFLDTESGAKGSNEIIGLSVSTSSSCILINVKNRGLFAYRLHGKLLWRAGPVIYQSDYRQGCRKNITDCYFTSVPVIDQCEASIYISNNEGELYALSVRSLHFKWIQDFSYLDKIFTVTPGNNGRVYVIVPAKSLVLALDVSGGTIVWQRSVGPLSTTDCAPVVDSNGWMSIGSLDGFLYSFSPTGDLKKFLKAANADWVVQISPVLDCSGYAVYISQTEMVGKVSRTIGDYTYVSAIKTINLVVTVLVPATGSIYWSESYPGPFTSLLSESDLQYFVLDERILLAFVSASNAGNPLSCRSTRQKLASSCSQTMPKRVSIYTGNERAILLFLLFESAILILLAALVRFCCVFWRKKKLQGQDLGKFLEKRSLRLQKKAFDRTITELEQKTAEAAVADEVLEELGDLVRERAGVERKLSTTYSFGRDRDGSRSKSILPLYNGKSMSYSFQGAKKASVTIFHTLSDTSSGYSSSDKESGRNFSADKESTLKAKAKAKAPVEVGSSSDDEHHHGIQEMDYQASPSGSASESKGFINPLYMEDAITGPEERKTRDKGKVMEAGKSGSRSIRRRTLSSTN